MSSGMTFAEIGREMGISATRAEFIFNRAIRKLRKYGARGIAKSYLLAADARRSYARAVEPPRRDRFGEVFERALKRRGSFLHARRGNLYE